MKSTNHVGRAPQPEVLQSCGSEGNYRLDESTSLLDPILETAFRIPHDAPPRWLLVLTIYADESGTHQDSDNMFVAGYLGNDEQWGSFPSAWAQAIYPRPHLHMRKLDFSKDSVRLMLEKAGGVPKDCGLTPVIGGIRQRDYRDIVFGTAEEIVMNGYAMSCYAMVYNVLRKIPDDERLQVVLDKPSQPGYSVYVAAAIETILTIDNPEVLMKDGRPKLASCEFVLPKSTVLTEAGDYLGYALYQTWKNQNSRKSEWCKPILTAHRGKGIGGIWSREEIREVMSDGPPLRNVLPVGVRSTVELARIHMGTNEFEEFTKALRAILRADPSKVKQQMEEDAKDRAEARQAKRASSSRVPDDPA